MQLTFIGTGHPAAIVLMNLSASNFFSLREGFSFACVDPFAMGLLVMALLGQPSEQR